MRNLRAAAVTAVLCLTSCLGELDPVDDGTQRGEDAGPMDDPVGTPVEALLEGRLMLFPEHVGKPVSGRVQLVKTGGAEDLLSVHATGLAPGMVYDAHVHALPCRAGGGGHYKHD